MNEGNESSLDTLISNKKHSKMIAFFSCAHCRCVRWHLSSLPPQPKRVLPCAPAGFGTDAAGRRDALKLTRAGRRDKEKHSERAPARPAQRPPLSRSRRWPTSKLTAAARLDRARGRKHRVRSPGRSEAGHCTEALNVSA